MRLELLYSTSTDDTCEWCFDSFSEPCRSFGSEIEKVSNNSKLNWIHWIGSLLQIHSWLALILSTCSLEFHSDIWWIPEVSIGRNPFDQADLSFSCFLMRLIMKASYRWLSIIWQNQASTLRIELLPDDEHRWMHRQATSVRAELVFPL